MYVSLHNSTLHYMARDSQYALTEGALERSVLFGPSNLVLGPSQLDAAVSILHRNKCLCSSQSCLDTTGDCDMTARRGNYLKTTPSNPCHQTHQTPCLVEPKRLLPRGSVRQAGVKCPRIVDFRTCLVLSLEHVFHRRSLSLLLRPCTSRHLLPR